MKPITALRELNFDVYLTSGGQVKYSYKGEQEPCKSKIIPILNELKLQKTEAIAYLKKEELYKTLKKAKDELNSECQDWEKVFDYLNSHNQELSLKIDEAQERIDNLWKEGRSLSEIGEAIKEWKEFNLEASRLFKLQK